MTISRLSTYFFYFFLFMHFSLHTATTVSEAQEANDDTAVILADKLATGAMHDQDDVETQASLEQKEPLIEQEAIPVSQKFFEQLALKGFTPIDNQVTYGVFIFKQNGPLIAVRFLNSEGTVTPKEGDDLAFTIHLKKPFSLTLFSGKIINFDRLDLSFTDSAIIIEAPIALFSSQKDAVINFSVDESTMFAQISVPHLALSQIHTIIEKTPLNSVTLTDVLFKISNLARPTVVIEGKADLSKLNLPIPVDLSHIGVTILITSNNFSLDAYLETLSIPNLGSISDAHLLCDVELINKSDELSEKTKKVVNSSFQIRGESQLNLPFNWGKLNAHVDAKLINKSFTFSAALEKNISFKDLVTLHQGQLSFTSDGDATVRGKCTVTNIDFSVALKINHVKGKAIVTLQGKALQKKALKPFEKVPVLKESTELRNITIEDLTLSLNSKGKLEISGVGGVYGFKGKARFLAQPKGVTLVFTVPESWNITQAIPGSKGSDWEDLALIDPQLIVSSTSFFDEEMDFMVKKGVSIVFRADLRKKPFNKIRDVLQKIKDKKISTPVPDFIRMSGTLSPILQENQISAGISLNFEIKPGLVFRDLVIALGGIPPSVFLKGNLHFKPQGQDEPLIFTGMLQISPLEALEVSIAGSMLGEWIDPFGFTGFTIRNVGAELGLSFSVIVGSAKKVGGAVAGGAGGGGGGAVAGGVTAVPGAGGGAGGGASATSATPDPVTLSKIGFTGSIDIGDQSAGVTARIVPEMWYKVILGGKLKKLYLTDIIKEISDLPEKMRERVEDASKKEGLKKTYQISKETHTVLQNIKKIFKKDEILRKIPNIKFEDLEFYLAPIGGQIGEIYFEPGFRLKGKMFLSVASLNEFKTNVDMQIQLIPPVVKAVATMTPITIAGLHISGTGADGKHGTADDGPVIDIELSMEKQQVLISGYTTFMDSKSDVTILVTPQGGDFKIQTKLAKRFMVILAGSTTTMQVTGSLQSDFRDAIKELVNKRLNAGNIVADIVSLDDINKKIDELDQKIADKNREIESSQSKMVDKQVWEKVKVMQEKRRTVGVGRFSKTVTTWEPRFDDVMKIVKVPFNVAPLVAQSVALNAERTALLVAQKTQQGAQKGLDVQRKVLENIMTSFEITQASLTGNLIELSRGNGVVLLRIRVLGRNFNVKTTLDTNDMGTIVEQVFNFVKTQIIK